MKVGVGEMNTVNVLVGPGRVGVIVKVRVKVGITAVSVAVAVPRVGSRGPTLGLRVQAAMSRPKTAENRQIPRLRRLMLF